MSGGRISIDENNPDFLVQDDVVYVKGNSFDFAVAGASVLCFADYTKDYYHISDRINWDGETLNVVDIIVTSFRDRGELPLGVSGSPFSYLINATNFDFDIDFLKFDGYCVYYSDSVLYYRKDINHFIYSNSMTKIARGAFQDCQMESILIPSSVKQIDELAFAFCYNLKDIYYEGTIEEWNMIIFEEYWDFWMNDYTIHCSDGDISVNGYNN